MIKNIAFYDLSAAPITFDFIHYLALARMHFVSATGSEKFSLVILVDKWRNLTPREKSYDIAERQWRLHNLIVPILSMSPFISSFEVSSTRPERLPSYANIFPIGYDLSDPLIPYMPKYLVKMFAKTHVFPQFLEVPKHAQQVATKMLQGLANPCLVSVRSSSFEPNRNTTSSMLAQSVKYSYNQGFDPIIIPDQESVSDFSIPIDKHYYHIFPEAAFSLPLRLAIAEQSKFSIFSPSGISGLCTMLKSLPTMIIYGLLGEHHLSTEDYYTKQGYNVNSLQGLPWTPKHQHWIWNSSLISVQESLNQLMDTVIFAKNRLSN